MGCTDGTLFLTEVEHDLHVLVNSVYKRSNLKKKKNRHTYKAIENVLLNYDNKKPIEKIKITMNWEITGQVHIVFLSWALDIRRWQL